MHSSYLRLALAVAGAGALTLALAEVGSTAEAAPSSTVVISEVYGAGGNSGATLTNDFIELYNRSASAVDLSNWSVQYHSSSPDFDHLAGHDTDREHPGRRALPRRRGARHRRHASTAHPGRHRVDRVVGYGRHDRAVVGGHRADL